ncbi:hypothetical protein OSTOST_08431, partial [Ostertagia ostertagi]
MARGHLDGMSDRSVENGLKWMTGILSSVAILLFIASIFFGCYMRRIMLHPETGITFRKSEHAACQHSFVVTTSQKNAHTVATDNGSKSFFWETRFSASTIHPSPYPLTFQSLRN